MCERCDPAVDATGYTLSPGYHHDSAVAGTHFGASSFGLIFGDWANGCQILPDVSLPTVKTAALTAALANPTSDTIAAIGARATSAITAINGASDANQGVEAAWAWWFGDAATCPKSGDTCNHTPAETADAMGAAFATAMKYRQAISRIKVQQGLVLLQEENVNILSWRSVQLKRDVVAHMLVPFYQGVIRSAQEMDAAAGSAERSAAQLRGDAYWKVITDAVDSDNFDFDATDRATLSTMFSIPPPKVSNYCAATARLLRNLPSATILQYAEERPAGSHATGTLVASTNQDGEVVHLTSADVGSLTAAAGKVCLADDGWQGKKEQCSCAQAEPDHLFTIDCADAAVIRAATVTLESTCKANNAGYEWGGAFATPANTHKWVAQAKGGAYADPSMKLVIFDLHAADKEHLLELAETAKILMAGACTAVNTQGAIPAPTAAGACYTLTFPADAVTDFHATVTTTNIANVAFFAEHVPTEFERDTHYFMSTDLATDIEPAAQTDPEEYNCRSVYFI